ncbi:phospholipase A2, membrane associated-like [Sorex araneus]|uniref:phospholipase A2, membrane associated-like n=1 Tax=Sorex araneus TaxID=42254 RepID=UPI002433CDB1|nr:phospholipase A2, membrane associated-like [Sorex araneus]
MKTLLLLAMIVAFGLLPTHGTLWNFQKMIKKTTGKNAITNYGFYGCYCAVSGKGTPKDATDRCCFAHDCCYRRLKRQGCGSKFLSYKVIQKNGKITCARQGSCRKTLCECDKKAALCFKRNRGSYNKKYQYYNNRF